MRLVLIFLLALATRLALADGCFVAEPQRAPPTIPVQRALLTWRFGVERLVIENTVTADSPNLGWLVPVPAEPTSVAVLEPGLVKTLAVALQPRLLLAVPARWCHYTVTALLIAYLVATFAMDDSGRPLGLGRVVKRLLYGAVLLGFWFGPISSRLGLNSWDTRGMAKGLDAGAAGPALPGVSVAQRFVAGSYDVAVLRAREPAAVGDWLRANGFDDLPASFQPVVADYVQRGWFFVAARYLRTTGGTSQPHPLAIAFPALTPVYPMRLTAVGGQPVHLELVAIAEHRAAVPGLATEVAAPFLLSAGDLPSLSQRELDLLVYHPDLPEYAWPGAWVTKLAGRLAPADMATDLEVALVADTDPTRQELWTPDYSRGLATLAGLAAAALALPAWAWWVVRRRGRRLGWGEFHRHVVSAALAIGLVLGLIVGPLLPAVAQASFEPSPVRLYDFLASRLAGAAGRELTQAQCQTILRDALHELSATNPITGEPTTNEFSPGNYVLRAVPFAHQPFLFTVQAIGGTLYLYRLDQHGQPAHY